MSSSFDKVLKEYRNLQYQVGQHHWQKIPEALEVEYWRSVLHVLKCYTEEKGPPAFPKDLAFEISNELANVPKGYPPKVWNLGGKKQEGFTFFRPKIDPKILAKKLKNHSKPQNQKHLSQEISGLVFKGIEACLKNSPPKNWTLIGEVKKGPGRRAYGSDENASIKAALVYIGAAKNGAVNDPHYIKSVSKAFGVSRETVKTWGRKYKRHPWNPKKLEAENIPQKGRMITLMMKKSGERFKQNKVNRSEKAVQERVGK